MAALTVNPRLQGFNEITASGTLLYFYGHPVPDNVKAVTHWYDVESGGTWIGWVTKSGHKDKHLIPEEGNTHENILALLVMMRMTG